MRTGPLNRSPAIIHLVKIFWRQLFTKGDLGPRVPISSLQITYLCCAKRQINNDMNLMGCLFAGVVEARKPWQPM